MFTGYCISSPIYVLTKLCEFQPQLFPLCSYRFVFGPFKTRCGNQSWHSRQTKMRHMTAKHMAPVDILIWPTQTIFPEIHIWKTPPAAKAKKQRVDTRKRAICYVNCAALRVGRDSQLYLNLKRWKNKTKQNMSLGSAMVVSLALLTQSLAELPYLKSVQILNAFSVYYKCMCYSELWMCFNAFGYLPAYLS